MSAAQGVTGRAKKANNRIDGDVLARVEIIEGAQAGTYHAAQQCTFTGAQVADRWDRESVAEGWKVLETVLGKAENLFGATAKAAVDVGEGVVEVGR
jgi:hypothetical protein